MDFSDLLTLESALVMLSSAIGSGILASIILSKWPWYQRWQDDFWKMVIAMIAPAPLALLGYFGLILLAYREPPSDPRAWAEAIYAILAAAIIGQLTHKLRGPSRLKTAPPPTDISL